MRRYLLVVPGLPILMLLFGFISNLLFGPVTVQDLGLQPGIYTAEFEIDQFGFVLEEANTLPQEVTVEIGTVADVVTDLMIRQGTSGIHYRFDLHDADGIQFEGEGVRHMGPTTREGTFSIVANHRGCNGSNATWKIIPTDETVVIEFNLNCDGNVETGRLIIHKNTPASTVNPSV
jgi:hypothetical protein